MNAAALVAVVVALQAAPAAARTITVSKSGKADYKTLADALRAAVPGDQISALDVGRVGTELQPDGQGFLIKKVIPESPAEKAGLQAGDRIVMVEDEEVKGWKVEELVARMVGKPGTSVTLRILRAGRTELQRIELIRGALTYPVTAADQKFILAQRFGDLEAAFELARGEAETGSAKAEEYLAFAYYWGRGVKKDLKAAARWSASCAEKRDAPCQRLYGAQLAGGEGVGKDLKESFKWTLRAADQSDPYAYMNLGSDYQYGLGVSADAVQARGWYQKALDAGIPQAQKQLDMLAGSGAPSTSAQDQDFRRRMAAGQERDREHAALMNVGAPAPAPAAGAPSGVTLDEVRRMIAESQKPAAPAAPELHSDVDAPDYKKPERGRDLAVVIGVEKYDALPPATYAARDADAVRAHLVALGFPERNVFELKNQEATRSAFAKELEARLERLSRPDSTVFVYFSGHGAPDPRNGDAYLMPFDGDPQFLQETGYPLKRLYAKLGALKARHVIVALDSCFSGAGGRSVLAKGVRPLVTEARVAPQASGKVAALTAAAGSEITGTLDAQGHGLFTYYMLKGLNEGKLTLGSLEAYVRPRVEDAARRENRDQTPQLLGSGAAGLELGQ